MDVVNPIEPVAEPTILDQINQCLSTILEGNPMPTMSFVNYYTLIYNYCTQQPGLDLATRLQFGNDVRVIIRDQLQNYLVQVNEELQKYSGEELLKNYDDCWTSYNFKCKMINGVFQYLNRSLNQSDQEFGNVVGTPFQYWQEIILTSENGKVSGEILKLFMSQQLGEEVNESLIKKSIESYRTIDPDLYERDIEIPYLDQLSKFYGSKAAEWIVEALNSPMTYFVNVSEILAKERNRLYNCLSPATSCKGYLRSQAELLVKPIAQIKDLLAPILSNDETTVDDINFIYKLIGKNPELYKMFINVLRASINEVGLKVIRSITEADPNKLDPKLYIESILKLSNFYMDQLISSNYMMGMDFILRDVIKQSIINLVKTNPVTDGSNSCKSSSLIAAKYFDQLLKSSLKDNVDLELDISMKFLTLLDCTDYFREYYLQYLKRRVIDEQSTMEAEENMALQLQNLWGYEFSGPLKQIFKDVSISATLVEQFHKEKPNKNKFTCKVLRSMDNNWTNETEFIVPIEQADDLVAFENFYKGLNKGKKLSWKYELSFGELKFKTMKLKVTLYQMAVLQMFNMNDSWKISEITQSTNLDKETILEICAPMIKIKLITLDDESSESEAKLSLNLEFTSEKPKLNFKNYITSSKKLKQSSASNEILETTIKKDREMQTQACIVRVMKARIVLSHDKLVEETVQQLKFPADPALLNKAIELLIEKQYLEKIEHGSGDNGGAPGSRVQYKYIS